MRATDTIRVRVYAALAEGEWGRRVAGRAAVERQGVVGLFFLRLCRECSAATACLAVWSAHTISEPAVAGDRAFVGGTAASGDLFLARHGEASRRRRAIRAKPEEMPTVSVARTIVRAFRELTLTRIRRIDQAPP
ncbi:MAG: hypothetical protein IPK01_15375 [Acidobacteria bacterium]|nr:hypothetical protein [Acidobacteriota bacterium]